MPDVLPPPEGLDLDEISTDNGLRSAIEREARKLMDDKDIGKRVNSDNIRLITFLASEIQRRIDNLSAEELQELERIHAKANEREIERKVKEITHDVESFVDDVNSPGVPIKFSRINELEDDVQKMLRTLDEDPGEYVKFLDAMKETMEKLEAIKKEKGKMLKGFERF